MRVPLQIQKLWAANRRLLSKLEGQVTEGLFEYSIVILDNERSESARQSAELCDRKSNKHKRLLQKS
jgi:hypothetical protein